MAEHNTLTGSQLHEPKGIDTAVSGQVYVSDGAGSGDWSSEDAVNEVVVNSITDFPAAVSGVITLEDGKRYTIAKSISTSTRFVAGANNSITAFNINSPTFEYTGTGTFFTGIDVNFDIHNIQLNCPNGKLFDFSDTVGGTYIVTVDTIRLQQCGTFGSFDDLQSLVIDNSSCLDCNQGIDLEGSNWVVLSILKLALLTTNASFIGLDLGSSVHTNVELANLFYLATSGGTGISGLAASANINTNNIASITDGTFAVTTSLSGVSEEDIRYHFSGNSNIPDTMPDAFLTMINNATATVIAVSSTPVLVAGTWAEEQAAQFTTTAAGRITYDGERNIKAPILLSLSCVMASGSDTDVTFSIYKNGGQLTNSQQSNTVKASATGNTSLMWQDTIESGDYFEVFVANEDTTTNILIQDAKFLIN